MLSVLVLMSTYNGEKFLREQLDSLNDQIGVDIHILVRDDGSTDNTLNILDEYESNQRNLTIIKGYNIGAGKSFFELAHYAQINLPIYDYYAFCDQDDVWMPDKLQNAIKTLDKYNESNKLYFCSAILVDAKLNYIRHSGQIHEFDYTTCVYRNPALGCTMVFDRGLFELFCLSCNRVTEIVSLHDAWLFKCAVLTDCIIVADKNPYINYRQHDNNVTLANKSIIKKYYSAFKRKFKRKYFYRMAIESFFNIYCDRIHDPAKKDFLLKLISYNKSLSNALKYLRVQRWKTEKLIDKILWDLLVLSKLY